MALQNEKNSRYLLRDWKPENPAFWENKGKHNARRNLWISVSCLLLAFCVWMLFSAVTVNLNKIGFNFTTDQLFLLTALPSVSGALLRVPYSFMVPIFGGRRWTVFSTAILIIPCVWLGIAVQNPNTPFGIFIVIALLCGFAGANFASSMGNISFFFPKAKQGSALGINGGLGNLGVSVMQLVAPLVIFVPVFAFLGVNGVPQADGSVMSLANAAWIWVPLLAIATIAAWSGMNDIAMSIGPMFGLFLHDGGVSFATIFCYALGSCMLGFLSASLVKTPYKPPVKREPISLDRFILLKGMPAGLSLLLLSIPYGMTTNYVAMYAREIGIHTQTGFFFTFMAIGMAISRIFSGKLVDRGKITQVIAAGLNLVIISFFLLASCVYLIQWNDAACTILFFGIALLMGIGFGIMFPAFNTLFVNLAPNNQRGTATSTYLTSWDVGIGIGMLTGGYIAEICSFDKAYLFGACLTVVSAVYFKLKVTPHYHKNKLR